VKSTVEHLNPTRVKLTVEVPFDELKPQFDKAYKALAGQVRVPGFRPGKVPARILDARLGRGAVLSEVVNDAVPVKYGEAVSESELSVLGQPEIEVTRVDDNQSIEFTAEVDIRPEFEVPDAATISVTVDDLEITDDDVQEQVDALRERFATTTAVERAAADGDLVTIDLRAAVGDRELTDAATDGLSYRIGAGDLVDGLDETLVGMAAGDIATFRTKLVAGEFAGQEADVTVTVTAVQERVLPEVDDEFAQLASEFDTVDELRADLIEKITRVKNLERGAQARDKVLEALLAAVDIPAPEGVVKAEVQVREHDAVHAFDHNDEAFAAYLEGEGKTREEFDAEVRESSEQAVRTQLLLDAMAEQAQVGVSQEEFTQRLMFNAQRIGVPPEQYFQRLQETGQIAAVFSDVRRGKALAAAVEQATVTDASGNVLNVPELFGVEDVPEDEESDGPGVIDVATVPDEQGSDAGPSTGDAPDAAAIEAADTEAADPDAADSEHYADTQDGDTLAGDDSAVEPPADRA
jgi:trigger factor